MDDEHLTPDERRAFDALLREQAPPPGLEQRVVDRLRATGALGRPPRRRWLWQTAAASVIFFFGFVAGRAEIGSPVDAPGGRYLLLLYGGEPASPEEEQARVAEYGDWARMSLGDALVAAEKLSDARQVMGDPAAAPASDQQPSGFFLIRAPNRDAAGAMAATCPHLRHGGTVVVRAIDDKR